MTPSKFSHVAILTAIVAAGAATVAVGQTTGQAQGQAQQSPQPGMTPGYPMSGTPMMPGSGAGGMPMMYGQMMADGRMPGMPMMGGYMMKVMFAVADVDGDGVLSFDEVVTIHKRIFDRADANKDGKVTPEEMQTFMRE
ncbi:EF-hand domain-containing protein [Rhizobium sp. P32RR-XVIII]|uniref:EF-hand domain-containing protein n=1 Tax=Rhizobium sp. P32RR-XVIII TaxID=2726738 RepID=UPI0014571C5F|nr:EF-hand domain-containing protein [Rhizobium sp. P32RR-XVIII]NLS07881.1 EF-hand domain-containing protein [Rhizobium sp. P32RR-XVIII]